VSTSVNRDVLGNVAFDFSGSYRESLVEDYDVNTLVSNRSTSLAANATARIGRSLTLDLGTSYSESESSGFSDRESWNGDASLSYSIGQRNAAFVSYSYTSTESAGRGGAFGSLDQTYQSVQLGLSRQFVSGLSARASVGRSYIDRANAETVGIDPENESTIFNVSLSGPFLPPRMFPKLDSSFNISYSTNRSPGLYDAGGRSLAYSLRLAWQARLNTRVSLSSSRDRSLTVRNLTAETTMVRAEVDQSLTNGINLNAFVGYRWREQEGIERESEILDAGGGFNTALGTKGYWSLSGRYTYSRSDSTDAIADFARHIATLSLNFRY
ncbi:MAG TPA: outer membrane beta-barrel protein, partial [Candidatus Synoicihabitans sp.]|nr:outer membrane beta-barrel protein [Candidatus Synoicihabitans sp.]